VQTIETAQHMRFQSSIKHYILLPQITNKIQGTILKLGSFDWPLTIAAVYGCHAISSEEYKEFLQSLGSRFIAGGGWNAKHMAWGSRLIT
jgi:hypothetical protein